MFIKTTMQDYKTNLLIIRSDLYYSKSGRRTQEVMFSL